MLEALRIVERIEARGDDLHPRGTSSVKLEAVSELMADG